MSIDFFLQNMFVIFFLTLKKTVVGFFLMILAMKPKWSDLESCGYCLDYKKPTKLFILLSFG